jgi:hypothetical protein
MLVHSNLESSMPMPMLILSSPLLVGKVGGHAVETKITDWQGTATNETTPAAYRLLNQGILLMAFSEPRWGLSSDDSDKGRLGDVQL